MGRHHSGPQLLTLEIDGDQTLHAENGERYRPGECAELQLRERGSRSPLAKTTAAAGDSGSRGKSHMDVKIFGTFRSVLG